ncbi:portal protein [Rhizobium sp. CFBP 8752]|uniref:portal protein n=1 Tax=Rhizobium sp. CFBP 8752 TaxID=2775301 RepID=UPI0017811B95|nr:portal protein [Rhizobium sp. CFBP 8752]MBD8663126.1 portal protein [Rhizobium sp. CFBP 8752]
MTDDDEAILNSITPQLKQAVTWSNSNIAAKSEAALRHYKREPFTNDSKLKGRSKWVSPKVQQATDWCSAQLFRIFDSPQSVVEFCGVGSEDEAVAKQMNMTVNWILRTRNSSAAYLTPVFQDSLLTGLGVLTAEFSVEEEESLPRMLKSVPNEMLVALNEQEEAGQIIIEEVGKAQTVPGPLGPVQTRDLKIRTIRRVPKFTVLPVPPEDLIISADATFDPETGGVRAKFQGHRKNMSRSELSEMGFDRGKVDELPAATDKTDGIALERSKDVAGEQGVGPDDVTVYTVYTKLKIPGDRKTRLWRLTIGGDLENRPVLLDHTEVTLAPYAAFCCFPISHHLHGLGAADRLLDDHTLISSLYRGVLDSLSQSVNPIKIVNPDTTNVDDLLNSNHAGAIVRSTDPTGGISYNKAPFAGADAIPVIDQLSRSLDMSTGTGESLMAIDASDLQRTSATAANLRSNASQLLLEGISRHLADTGYRMLVRVVISLLMDNPDEAAELFTRLTNQSIALDQWSMDFDLATSVVFGTMSRDQSQGQLTNLLNQQYQALQAGLPIVNAQSIYATLSKLIEGQGLKNTSPFLVDPSSLPPAPPPPPPVDPNAGLIEVETANAQLKAQSDEADRQFQMAKARMDDDRLRDQMAQDFELKRAEIEAKYAAQVQIERLKLEQSAPRDPMGTIIQ